MDTRRTQKHYTLLWCLLITTITAMGQDQNIIPPSPQTQLFEKYLNYPVDMSTGVPDITIPLYEVTIKGMKIPINLSYHASGIKYKQYDGDVAVGWVLNPGYRISRTVKGAPDEQVPMPSTFVTDNQPGSTLDGFLARFYVNPNPNDSSAPSPSGSSLDGEHDLFSYMLPAGSGHFIITDRTARQVDLLEKDNLKIGYSLGLHDLTVNDENGFTYYMGKSIVDNSYVYENGGSGAVSAWPVMNIVSPLGERIDFKYNTGTVYETVPTSQFIISEATDLDGTAGSVQLETTQNVVQPNTGGYASFSLSEIDTKENTVKFNGFQGLSYAPPGIVSKDIEVYDAAGALLKKITLYCSTQVDHLFLDSLTIAGSNGEKEMRYKFQYYSPAPQPGSFADQWGYSKLCSLSQTYQGYDQDFSDDTYIHGVANMGIYPFSIGDLLNPLNLSMDRIHVTSAPNFGSLQTITYPTGGRTTYEYEPNRYISSTHDNEVLGSGLRVSRILSYDNISPNPVLIKRYAYGNNEDGMGIPKVDLSRANFSDEKINFGGNFGGTNQTITTLSSSVTGDYDINGIFYPSVTEYVAEGNLSGKTVYQYAPPMTANQIPLAFLNQVQPQPSPNYPRSRRYFKLYNDVDDFGHANAPLIERTVYSWGGANYTPVKDETFTYSSMPGNTYTEFYVNRYSTGVDLSYSGYPVSGVAFDYGTTQLTGGKMILIGKTVTDYVSTGAPVITNYQYTYNSLNQLSSEEQSDSKSTNVLTTYKYPVDYSGITATDATSAGIAQLQAINKLSPVIEKSQWKVNADNSQSLISSVFTNYYSNVPLPSQTSATEAIGMINNFAPSAVQSGAITTDSHYQPRVVFDAYDALGNVLEQHQVTGPHTCYVWGYNNLYPIAQIKNTTYATVAAVLGGSAAIASFNATVSPSDASVNAFLEPLRTDSRMQGALITTYTYKPSVGMSSITDPKGETTSYEYDAFQRLMNIRDKDGHITKHMDYNYQH